MAVNFDDLIPDPVEVQTGKGSFPVRGLPLPDLIRLLREHTDAILSLFSQEPSAAAVMAASAPDLVNHIIAIGSDSEGQEGSIDKLPTSVKLTALIEIWKLSVPDLKKLAELLSEATAALEKVGGLESKSLMKSLQTLPANPSST